MTVQRVVVAAGVIGLAVLTVVLFLSSIATVQTVRIENFQHTADPQKLIVNVVIGLRDEIVERSVDEDARAVKIIVRVRKPTGVRLSLGVPVPILVSLKQPLEGRVVLDHDGSPVRDLGQYFGPASTPRP
jgi:hypothetical protein